MFLNGCSPPQADEIERIEIRQSGWSAIDIELNEEGEGRYHSSQSERSDSISITPKQFEQLIDRLEPYRREAVSFTEESAGEMAMGYGCPDGVPYVTDAGAIWIHWIGPNIDQHFLAELGCDYERYSERNDTLREVILSLPIPRPEDW